MANNEGSVGFKIVGISFDRLSYYDSIISSVDTSNPSKLPTEEVCYLAKDALHEIFVSVSSNFSSLSSSVCSSSPDDLIKHVSELNSWYNSIYSKCIKPLRAIIAFNTFRLH